MKTLRLKRFLSLILILTMLVQMLPIQSFAAATSSAVDVASRQPVATVLGEVKDLREEDTKHFRLSDGSFIAVSYGMPVHYEDEDGNWENIDNTIVQNSKNNTYQLNREDAVVAFANALTNGTVLTTSVGDMSITMSVLDTNQALQMIAGEEESELMGEEEAETQAAETVPEETVDETVPEETEAVTEPEETVAETVPEETEPVAEPEETVAETEPGETISETTVAVVEDEVQETVAETVAEAVDTVSDTTEATEVVETEPAVAAASVDETVAEETEPEEATSEAEEAAGETTETLSEEAESSAEAEETTAATIPEETEALTVPEETTVATVPEETEAATEPEETVPETTATESETIGEMDADAVVAPIVAGGISFDRTATAAITAEVPTMLSLQENYSWDVEDVIPDNLQSSLLYEDVFPDIDLLYTAFGHNIKEQIIVNKAQDAYRYDFLLDLDGLTATLNEDGSVSFMDADNNLVYHIPVPFMEDEAGVLSDAVEFVLSETTQGLILTVEADAAWINADEREFPVKIDPSFVIHSGAALDQIYSNYTMEAAPNDTTLGRQYLYVGAQPYSTSNDGRYRTFMHFNDMPDIPTGYEVVGAELQLYQQLYTQRDCSSFPVGIYEVTTSLPSSYSSYYNWFAAMTWRNNMPSYDESNVIDYVMVDSTKGYRYWNITELVKKWYAEGTENATCALVMMNEDEIDTYYYFASVAFLAYASSIPPILIVSYRNNTGIEPYYTYVTLGGASAGTAYVADATGQLKVGKELLSYASSTNPFSLNLVYNSDYFALTPGTDYQPPGKLGLSMNVGSGWTLDYIQTVEAETISDIDYLKYTDGDGTIHYFMEDSTPDDSNYPYYDEDGLGLKMKVNSTNNYTMADDDGNEWTFTNNYLTSVKDSDGNKININYNSGRIQTITQVNNGQSAVEVASFNYSGNNLTSVEDAAGNVYTLVYSDTKLASIQKNGTPIAAYTYDGYRLTKMTDSESVYALSFTYDDGKIASYKELGGSTSGATVAVSYPSHSQTTYRDYGADRTANTSDDILTHYLFDYARRTANAYTTDNTGNILGATNAAYYTSEDRIDKRNNRTVRSASIGIAGQQYLKNTSIENSADGWSFNNNTRRSSSDCRTGTYSIKGTLSDNGTQYAQYSSESLTANTTYTLSAYINTSGATNFYGTGVYLKVSDGTNTWESHPINYTTSTAVDDGWVRVSVTFTAETSAAHTVSVYNSGVSQFYADDFQLEVGEAPSSYNMVENGNMGMSDHGWTMGTDARYSTSRGAASSLNSLKVTGNPADQTTNAYQDIALNLPGSQTYVLSGWVQANAVPDDDNNTDEDLDSRSKECGLRAIITYSDGGTETHYVPFNTDLSNTWQFVSLTVVPKETSKTVSSIRVVCAFEGNANAAYFDDISLVREAAQTMRYDDDGNLVSVESPGLEEDTNSYSGGNLIQTVTGGNGTYEYTYDTTYKHRLKSVTNNLITQSMDYDASGNVTSTTLSGNGGKTISTSATYGGSQNRLTSITDATGATVTYGYGNVDSQMMALPTSITDPNGTVTTSSYDSNYRVTQTGIANEANLVYNYDKGNLSSVKRTNNESSDQTYSFTYDAFGNMTALKVGSQTLATYTYGAGNGLLMSQTYANGDSVSFAYDNLGRTKTATYSDGRVLTYVYNGEGNLHSVTETNGSATVTYLYTYDSIGRLISSEQKDGSTTTLRTHQTYNAYNQLKKQGWQIGTNGYSEEYTYNSADGSLATMKTGVGNTLTMGYDGLRRLSTVSGGPFNRTYAYRDISSSNTTMQVSGLSYSLGGGMNFGYTYDELGNIETYTAPGGEVITYTYDAQGQLLKAEGDTTYNYTYDSVGNIRTANGHSYTYGNSNWKDLLTAFDGESIIYDESGNPISYYNGTRWTLEWNNGRQLVSASDGATTITYTYDANGLRTGKTVTTAQYETVLKNGLRTDDDGAIRYYVDGLPYYAGLIQDEDGNYYYINSSKTAVRDCTYTVSKSNNLLPVDNYTFGADGKMKNGLSTDNDGEIRYYVTGKSVYAGLLFIDGYFYYINSSKVAVRDCTYWIALTNDLLPAGNYNFDEQGRMVNPPATQINPDGTLKNGLCVDTDGETRYYINGVAAYVGLIFIDGYYYYFNSSKVAVRNCTYTISKNNDLLPLGTYSFDEQGRMIDPPASIAAQNLELVEEVAVASAEEETPQYETVAVHTKTTQYNYIYAGGKLLEMTVETTETGEETISEILEFFYDANGTAYALKYNGTVYYYVTNLQGDVIQLVNESGTAAATYDYDPYGKVISASGTLAEANPIRYRGYYYDNETGLYYLQSRYYDPAIGRFVNVDGYASTGQGIIGFNMYAYCGNNPIMGSDPTGDINWLGVGIGVGLAVLGVLTVAAALTTGGAAVPLIAAATKTAATAIGIGMVATGVTTAYTAAKEETLVLDASVSNGGTRDKQGYSVVVDFESDSMDIETYYHYGKTTAGYGATYGAGVVIGYEGPGDYGGYFADAGATISHNFVEYGVDVCTDPFAPFSKCSAVLAVVGVSFPDNNQGKVSGYLGVDYYLPVAIIKWEH